MSEMNFYERTRYLITEWLSEIVREYGDSRSFAVLGGGLYARFIKSRLIDLGVNSVVFVLKDSEVFSGIGDYVTELSELNSDHLFLSGSMSSGFFQQQRVLEMYPDATAFYLPCSEVLCTNPVHDPVVSEILEGYRDKHRGQEFLLVGNGPSLRGTPPEKVSGKIVFGGNGILIRESLNLDYYFALDNLALKNWWNLALERGVNCFLPSHLFEYVGFGGNVNYFHACYTMKGDSLDPVRAGVPSGGTVMSSMIYFAIYMGARKIYLLGVDNNYSGRVGESHFSSQYYKKGAVAQFSDKAREMEKLHGDSIRKMVSFACLNGVDVLDATPVDNKLGLDKICFDELIG